MPGHVFIIPGDVRRLACDAWLIPCSRRATPHRFRPPHWPEDFAWTTPDDDQWWSREQRVFKLPNPPEGEPDAWMVNVVYPREAKQTSDDFYRDTVRQAMRAVLPTLAPAARNPRNRRAAPLLAMPFLGSGLGMMRMVERGHMLRLLLSVVQEELDAAGNTVDVALVTFGSRPFAAAQHARLSLGRGWPGLGEPLLGQARRLAALAADGNLALFLGAGVGVGAGLPTWEGMVAKIAGRHQLSPEVCEFLQDERRDILDRASYLAAVVGGAKELREAIIGLLGCHRRYSLAHGLLAGLPVREAITTNYDELFEAAWEGAAAEPTGDGGFARAARTSVIPHRWEADHQRWLLKLHGSIARPESIVLTRESYIRFSHEWAALEGLLQATLLTRHMLFVGFSLRDPNFIRILDTVRRIVRPEGAEALHGRPFGTALMVGGDEMFRHLYQSDLEWVSLGGGAEAGRRLEVFLDCLLAQTRSPAHLLDEDFDSVLSGEERRLRQLLKGVAGEVPCGERGPAWERVARLLREFGWRPGP